MHRQWKSEHFSSHYLGPKGVEPKNGDDIQEALRTRIAELFPHVPKEQILIEQFVRCGLSHAQRDDDEDADDEPLTQPRETPAGDRGAMRGYGGRWALRARWHRLRAWRRAPPEQLERRSHR